MLVISSHTITVLFGRLSVWYRLNVYCPVWTGVCAVPFCACCGALYWGAPAVRMRRANNVGQSVNGHVWVLTRRSSTTGGWTYGGGGGSGFIDVRRRSEFWPD